MPKTFYKKSIFLFLIFLILISARNEIYSQSSNSFYWEPEFSVEVANGEKWSHTFGIADRTLLHESYGGEKISGFNNEHLELNHFTKYKTSSRTAVSFGIRYRFREIFEDSRYDELRFVEQFNLSHPHSSFGLGHRFRIEQRLRNIETIHRFRYQLSGSKALNDIFSLGISTEALYSISQSAKPSLEQRFSLGFKNTSFERLELSAGVEYQMENYNIDTENEFFITTGVGLEI